MRIINVVIVSGLLLAGCGSHQTAQEKKEPEPPKSYFPVQEYIKGEIKLIDSLPVGIMRKFSSGNKKDTGFIDRNAFHQLASEFASDQLSKSALEKQYTESAFKDETTGYFTMNYLPTTDSAPLRRVDVTVKQGTTADKVNSIYVEKEYALNDTSVIEKLYWKANTSFTITREKTFKNQNPVIEQLLVIWDPAAY